jgi:hypothetical protein
MPRSAPAVARRAEPFLSNQADPQSETEDFREPIGSVRQPGILTGALMGQVR